MDKKKVFELAIGALYAEAEDTYCEEEQCDPAIAAWIQERHDAIAEIQKFQIKLTTMGFI